MTIKVQSLFSGTAYRDLKNLPCSNGLIIAVTPECLSALPELKNTICQSLFPNPIVLNLEESADSVFRCGDREFTSMVQNHIFGQQARCIRVIISLGNRDFSVNSAYDGVFQMCIHTNVQDVRSMPDCSSVTRLHLVVNALSVALKQLPVILFAMAQNPSDFYERNNSVVSGQMYHTEEQFFAFRMHRLLERYLYSQSPEIERNLIKLIRSSVDSISNKFPVMPSITHRPVSGSCWHALKDRTKVTIQALWKSNQASVLSVNDAAVLLYGETDWENSLTMLRSKFASQYPKMAEKIWEQLGNSGELKSAENLEDPIKIAINSLMAEYRKEYTKAMALFRTEMDRCPRLFNNSVGNLQKFFEGVDKYYRLAGKSLQKEYLLQELQRCISGNRKFWDDRRVALLELSTAYTKAQCVLEPGLYSCSSIQVPSISFSWQDPIDLVAAQCQQSGEEWENDQVFDLVYKLSTPKSCSVDQIVLLFDPNIVLSNLTHGASAADIRIQRVTNLGKTKFLAIIFSSAPYL